MRAFVRFVIDDAGQDLVEYGLLAGIIGVIGTLLFPVIAGRMQVAYNSWQLAVQDKWEPCPPAPAVCP